MFRTTHLLTSAYSKGASSFLIKSDILFCSGKQKEVIHRCFALLKLSNEQGLKINGLDPDSIMKSKENSGHVKTLLFLNQITW
jgi:hypothetical protein